MGVFSASNTDRGIFSIGSSDLRSGGCGFEPRLVLWITTCYLPARQHSVFGALDLGRLSSANDYPTQQHWGIMGRLGRRSFTSFLGKWQLAGLERAV